MPGYHADINELVSELMNVAGHLVLLMQDGLLESPINVTPASIECTPQGQQSEMPPQPERVTYPCCEKLSGNCDSEVAMLFVGMKCSELRLLASQMLR
jgi:hypothetical protein